MTACNTTVQQLVNLPILTVNITVCSLGALNYRLLDAAVDLCSCSAKQGRDRFTGLVCEFGGSDGSWLDEVAPHTAGLRTPDKDSWLLMISSQASCFTVVVATLRKRRILEAEKQNTDS